MGRRVTLVGAGLIAVGLLLGVLVRPPTLQAPGLPMDRAVYFLLGLVPAVGWLVTVVGSVLVALGVLALVTGRPPAREHPAVLVWAAAGAWVLALLLESGLLSSGSAAPTWLMLAVASVGSVLRTVGAAMVALWLAGLLASRDATGSPRSAPGVDGYDEDEDESTHV